MKLSESLLNDKEIGKCIFDSSIEKTEKLLTKIFGLEFKDNDNRIISYSKNTENKNLKIEFNFNQRKILAVLDYKKKNEDILCEILSISETAEEEIPIIIKTNKFEDIVKEIHDILENKYDLNFIPLDPDEKDINIININSNHEEKTWEAIFTADYHESEFKAKFKYSEGKTNQTINVTENKKHIIYLD